MPLEGWPARAGPERSARIIEAVRSGNFEHRWCPLQLSDGSGSTLSLEVSCDALKVDGVRVNVSADLQQQVADLIGALLLTPKLADEIYKRATKLRPQPMPITSSTAGMIEHSRRVDVEVERVGGSGKLVADPGKDWVLVRSIFSANAQQRRAAANFGWHRESLPPIQGVGTVHNDSHEDYSQIARFVRRKARFGELPVDLEDVYTGRAPGTALVSHEGPLPDYRQPGGPPGGLPPVSPAGFSGGGGAGIAAPVALTAAGGAVGYLIAGSASGGIWGAAAGLVLGLLARRSS